MEVISIVNLKGGVGKTITACNLAAILGAFHYKRVLLVDADAQANASQFYNAAGDVNHLGMVLDGLCDYWPEFVYETETPGVSILPADISLLEQDIAALRRDSSDAMKHLGDLILTIEDDNAFDYVIFDCPPAFSAASVAAILCSSRVIIPTKLDAFSISGVGEITAQVRGLRQIRPGIRVDGVLITQHHNSPVQEQGEALLRSSGLPVYKTRIRRTDKVDEATFARQPLFQWSKTSSAGRDYIAFAEEVLAHE